LYHIQQEDAQKMRTDIRFLKAFVHMPRLKDFPNAHFFIRKAQSARLSAKIAQAPPRRLSPSKAWACVGYFKEANSVCRRRKKGPERITPMALGARQRST